MHIRTRRVSSAALTMLLAGLCCPALALGQEGNKPQPRPSSKPSAEPAKPSKAKVEGKIEKVSEKRGEKMKDRADTDGDGKVSEAERLAAKERMKARQAAFKSKVDTNRDGKISIEEWQAVSDEWKDFDGEFDRAIKSLDGNARAALIKSLDTNGNGEIDEPERAAIRARAEERRFELMARFDFNNDGRLDEQEKRNLGEFLKASRQPSPKAKGKPGAKDPEHPAASEQHGK